MCGENSLALQNRQPEDKGYPFPEYACHGGGESFNNALFLLAPHPAALGEDPADPENHICHSHPLLPFHCDPDCNYRLPDLVEEQYGLSDRDDLGQRSASGGGSSGRSMGPSLGYFVATRWRLREMGELKADSFHFSLSCRLVGVNGFGSSS